MKPKISRLSRETPNPKYAAIIVLIVIAAAGAILIFYALWNKEFLLADWQEKKESVDLNNDGEQEILNISNRAFCVSNADGQVMWNGGSGWLVEDFQYGDINRDGENELLLLVWKRGSYGKYRPFWVKDDEKKFSQHIFIYKWTADDKPDAIWMSSKLNPGVSAWSMNSNGTINILTAGGDDTVWAWNTWGLERMK